MPCYRARRFRWLLFLGRRCAPRGALHADAFCRLAVKTAERLLILPLLAACGRGARGRATGCPIRYSVEASAMRSSSRTSGAQCALHNFLIDDVNRYAPTAHGAASAQIACRSAAPAAGRHVRPHERPYSNADDIPEDMFPDMMMLCRLQWPAKWMGCATCSPGRCSGIVGCAGPTQGRTRWPAPRAARAAEVSLCGAHATKMSAHVDHVYSRCNKARCPSAARGAAA